MSTVLGCTNAERAESREQCDGLKEEQPQHRPENIPLVLCSQKTESKKVWCPYIDLKHCVLY